MFGPSIQQHARRLAERIVRPLAALGLTPNMATLLGLVLNAATAWVIAVGHLRIGGAMLLFAGVFDMFDGALARVRNQKTVFGAFFDSTLDRFSEGIVLLGIIVYALTQPVGANRVAIVCLAYAAGLGSLMVSYTRARAEGLGLEAKNGLMARPERVVLLTAGLLLGGFIQPAGTGLLWTLAILAITSVFTSVQRIVAVYRLLARREHEESSREQAAAQGRQRATQARDGQSNAGAARATADETSSGARARSWRTGRSGSVARNSRNGRMDKDGQVETPPSPPFFGKRRPNSLGGSLQGERATRR